VVEVRTVNLWFKMRSWARARYPLSRWSLDFQSPHLCAVWGARWKPAATKGYKQIKWGSSHRSAYCIYQLYTK